jgi:hypothetical protein
VFYIPHDCPREAVDRHCRSTATALHPAALLARDIARWVKRLGARMTARVPEETVSRPASVAACERGGLTPPSRPF